MIVLETQRDFQSVAKFPFCYLCGYYFGPRDQTNGDHVPPKNMFAIEDRTPPLILKAHETCNSKHKINDELIGQLISLQRGYVTPDPKNFKLKGEVYPGQDFGSFNNVDVVKAVWRYILGFHAALYQKPLILRKNTNTITTPFTPAQLVDGDLVLEGPKKDQYLWIVQFIKNQRAGGNVDRIISNNGKVRYECVWVYAAGRTKLKSIQPACLFALDIYDWKTLGDVGVEPARGCVGAYFTSDGQLPIRASIYNQSAPNVGNQDPWDPFGP